ncbi:MAG: YgjP-like metallopeptidase domain-containing protein [Pseudomonadota bacterium]
MTPAYRIRRRRNARRITLKVLPDRSVEVVAPPGLSERAIASMVEDRCDWIAAARARLLQQQQARAPELDDPFPTRIELPAIENTLIVHYDDSARRNRLDWSNRQLTIAGPRDAAQTARALIQALKTIAQHALEPQLHQLAGAHGYTLERVGWRNQKSRWGSCRRMRRGVGRLSLNIRLLLLPPASARSVLLHELAHIDHPNHSPAFWQRVEVIDPNYRQHQQVIKAATLELPIWIV